MSSTQLRQLTNESDYGVNVRYDTVLDEASEAGIDAPITNNITRKDFSKLEIFVELTKNNTRSGAGSLTMIVQNDKDNELEFHRTTRYSELKTLAGLINMKQDEELALGFPDSFCDKTSTLTEKCTIARTNTIQQYFMNVKNVYGHDGWEENDEFLEFLQEKKKWRVKERKSRSRGGGKKTRKRKRKRKGGKKTSKRKRKGKRKTRKRKKSLKKRRRGRKRTKRRR